MIKSFFQKGSFLLLLASFLFGLIISELILRQRFLNSELFIWKPYTHVTYEPIQEVMPGIWGKSEFIVNSQGLRADEPPKNAYQILTVGGSTTECKYLDQSETWPYLLQEFLKKQGHSVWTGNAGVSGYTTKNHVEQLPRLLKQFSSINTVIVLIGINDFVYYIADPNSAATRFYANTGFYELFRILKRNLFKSKQKVLIDDNDGKSYIQRRKQRHDATTLLNELPSLKNGLTNYRKNIQRIISIAKNRSVRLIFMTQPFSWQENMTPEFDRLLWLGWSGSETSSRKYYSIKALMSGLQQYNDALLQICSREHIECIDLAGQISKNSDNFFDDVHFNEKGALEVAGVVKKYLEDLPPFGSQSLNPIQGSDALSS